MIILLFPFLLVLFICCLVALYILYKLNLESEKRYLQWDYLLVLLKGLIPLIGISCIVTFLNIGSAISSAIFLGANLVIIIVVAVVKYFKLKIHNGDMPHLPDHPPLGYEIVHSSSIRHQDEWYYPKEGVLVIRPRGEWFCPKGGALIYCGFAALLPLLLMVVPLPLIISSPPFPIIAVLILLEVGWYLDGRMSGDVNGNGATVERDKGRFSDIWDEYQLEWSERVLVAYRDTKAREDCKKTDDKNADPGSLVVKLKNKESLLIKGFETSYIFEEILLHIWERIVEGINVALFVPEGSDAKKIAEFIKDYLFKLLPIAQDVVRVDLFSEMHFVDGIPRIVLLTTRDILISGDHPRFKDFAGKVRVLWFPEASAIYSAPFLATHTKKYFECFASSKKLQVIIMDSDRFSSEASLESIFSMDIAEISIPSESPRFEEVIIWKGEGDKAFQNSVLERKSPVNLGIEPILSYFAWVKKIYPITQVNQGKLPWCQRYEELINHHNDGKFVQSGESNLDSPLQDSLVYMPPNGWSDVVDIEPFITARDADSNFPRLLATLRSKGSSEVFVQIVTAPYILRDYFAANMEYFVYKPVLSPYSPTLTELPFTQALVLLHKLVLEDLKECDLNILIRDMVPIVENTREAIFSILMHYFGIEESVLQIMITQNRSFEFDLAVGRFPTTLASSFRLSKDILDIEELSWLRKYTVCDPDGKTLEFITAEHVHQSMFKGRCYPIAGQIYAVERIDDRSKQVIVKGDSEAQKDYLYRPDLTVTLECGGPVNSIECEDFRGIQIKKELSEVPFHVVNQGWLEFDDRLTLAKDKYVYINGSTSTRSYRFGRMFRLLIGSTLPAEQNQIIAHAISFVISEMRQTLFPENHHLLLVGTQIDDPTRFFSEFEALHKLSITFSSPHDDIGSENSSWVNLLAVEDSISDLGMCQFLATNWDKLLEQVYDYFEWVTDGENYTVKQQESLEQRKGTFINDSFLRLGMDSVSPLLDPLKARDFLARLGFASDRDSMTSRRKAFYKSEDVPPSSEPDV